MRKLISGTLMSLNGVIGSPHKWAEEFDPASATEALRQLERSHAMLMGRGTYEIFSRLWPGRPGDYPSKINAIRKYVFSATLLARIRSEESLLHTQFGEPYDAYRRRTSRLIPGIY